MVAMIYGGGGSNNKSGGDNDSSGSGNLAAVVNMMGQQCSLSIKSVRVKGLI